MPELKSQLGHIEVPQLRVRELRYASTAVGAQGEVPQLRVVTPPEFGQFVVPPIGQFGHYEVPRFDAPSRQLRLFQRKAGSRGVRGC